MRFTVKDFKSIRNVEYELSKVNVFTGKKASDLAEALCLLGYAVKRGVEETIRILDFTEPLNEYVRVTQCRELLPVYQPGKTVIEVGNASVTVECESEESVLLDLRTDSGSVRVVAPVALSRVNTFDEQRVVESVKLPRSVVAPRLYSFDRYCVYRNVLNLQLSATLPPYLHETARNWAMLLYDNRELRKQLAKWANEVLGYKLFFSHDSFFKLEDNILIPPHLFDESSLRALYYATALLSNHETEYGGVHFKPIVVLERPEAYLNPLLYAGFAELVEESARNGNIVVIVTESQELRKAISGKVRELSTFHLP